jgi:hypothetical protein
MPLTFNCLTEFISKKKQLGINHTQEGIGNSRQPAGQVEGQQKEGKRKGKKHQGAGEKPQQHHHTKPEQHGMRSADSVAVQPSLSLFSNLQKKLIEYVLNNV